MGIFSVSELIQQIRASFHTHPVFSQPVQVEGEISGFKVYGRHAYFSLKDEQSLIKGVFFNVPRTVVDHIQDGMLVLLAGRIDVYAARGDLQVYAISLEVLSREGYLQIQFQNLKERLIKEGIIPRPDDQKRPLPTFPHKIAVIASRGSAALQDMLKVFRNRYPLGEVMLFHTSVQGASAKKEITRALSRAQSSGVGLIILARGGGSLEDLWPFNEEIVVRAVRHSKCPVITGVGHETDFTLVDYAADWRLATPTAAAAFATPDLYPLIDQARKHIQQAGKHILSHWSQKNQMLEIQRGRIRLYRPDLLVQRQKQRIVHIQQALSRLSQREVERRNQVLMTQKNRLKSMKLDQKIQQAGIRLQDWEKRMNALHPHRVVQRGFSWLEKDGQVIQSVLQLRLGERVRIVMRDGSVHTRVEEIISEGDQDGKIL